MSLWGTASPTFLAPPERRNAVARTQSARYNPLDYSVRIIRLRPKVGAAMKLDSYASPEMALLLAASRGDPTREPVRRLMAGQLDWPRLLRLAIDSHAIPGLWHVVSKFPDLPAEADVLQSLAVVNDFRRYHIRALTARVSSELAREGIEVIALKGAAL